MNPIRHTSTPMQRWYCPLGLVLAIALGAATPVLAQDAASLQARDTALNEAMAHNAFQRPLVLESSERADSLQGDIYARIDQPFALVGAALQGIEHWCDILMLHLNTKQCRASHARAGDALQLLVGQKHDQPLDQAYLFDFAYQVIASRPDYLQVKLAAEEGPLGTSRYRIVLEVAALDARRSVLHLSYSYGYGVVARMAMQAYLATVGRHKVGFGVVGTQADGRPQYIAGTRGVIERNTMRYYVAVEAYLGALTLPAALQFERRLAAWFAGIERYPLQLHELELGEYLTLKRAQRRLQLARAP